MSGGLTLTINSFSLIIFVSALLYLLMQVFVQRKVKVNPTLVALMTPPRQLTLTAAATTQLRFLHARSPELDTKKLFVMSVWLACVVRVMSFVGLGALQIANVQVNYSMSSYDGGDDDRDENQAFYDKAVIVLFDLPDYVIISTYVLMTLVWAEVRRSDYCGTPMGRDERR